MTAPRGSHWLRHSPWVSEPNGFLPGPSPCCPTGAVSPSKLDYTNSVATGSERISNNSVAWAAILSAGLAFGIAPVAGAVVALLLAHVALREGTTSALARLAARSALALGGANLALCALATGWWLVFAAGSPTPGFRARPTAPVPALAPNVAHRSSGAHSPDHFSEDGQVRSLQIGGIELIDLGTDIDSLYSELRRQARAADAAGQSMIVWVSAPNCSPCNGVSAALADGKMQAALENTRLVRVNRDAFAGELDALGIPVRVIPGFAQLDAKNRPVDYLDGGEWDEDLPHNIAPVLGGFLRGNYNNRRRPWRGTTRRKITTL